MSAAPTVSRFARWRMLGALALLGLIGVVAWKSVPQPRPIFAAADLAISREYMAGPEFTLAPDATSGAVARAGTSVRAQPGSSLRFDVSHITGILHGRLQAADGKTGATVDFVAADATGGGPVTVLRRVLRPAAQAGYDSAPMNFLLNPAALPPGTKSVLLSVPPDSAGAVDWTRVGATPPEKNSILSALPLPLIAYEGFAEAAADGATIFAHAPFEFVFQVPAGPREFTGRVGMNPALFSRSDASSDGIGVRFMFENGADRQVLFARQFDPQDRTEDRQLATAHFALAGAPGSRLVIAVDPGPRESINWDWTVLQDLKVDPPARP
ncbi:MAG TPA: hypothetical protein VFJ90_08650 [Candidatus Didemnitutus sp.]|nr:hypothetical protein [Candidatus Didemnitutus sp.]